jgi:hypothetical protein
MIRLNLIAMREEVSLERGEEGGMVWKIFWIEIITRENDEIVFRERSEERRWVG